MRTSDRGRPARSGSRAPALLCGRGGPVETRGARKSLAEESAAALSGPRPVGAPRGPAPGPARPAGRGARIESHTVDTTRCVMRSRRTRSPAVPPPRPAARRVLAREAEGCEAASAAGLSPGHSSRGQPSPRRPCPWKTWPVSAVMQETSHLYSVNLTNSETKSRSLQTPRLLR